MPKRKIRVTITSESNLKKALKSPWKIKKCNDKNCWCHIIIPADPELRKKVAIISAGCVDKKTAKHIVKLHNKSLKNSN